MHRSRAAGEQERRSFVPSGPELKQQLESKVSEIKELVSRVEESRASQAPAAGEWCVKEVLTHLGVGSAVSARYKRIVEEETPFIEISLGQSNFDEQQRARPVGAILGDVVARYSEVADYLGSLSGEQLQRKAHVPLFKETPFGEYPTLEQLASGLINFHMAAHASQLQNLCR
jgi:hypothetical protein